MITQFLNTLDKDSNEKRILQIIQFLDYHFISNDCLSYLTDMGYDEISTILNKLEDIGILKVNSFDLNANVNSFCLNKKIIEKLREKLGDGENIFLSVFCKIEEKLFNSNSSYDDEYYFHFLEIKNLSEEKKYVNKIRNIERFMNQFIKTDVIFNSLIVRNKDIINLHKILFENEKISLV